MFDQLYADFTSKVLPKVAEGFAITKEYFTDLFGRYIKYLIIIDTAWLIFWTILFLTMLIGGFFILRAGIKQNEEWGVAGMFMMIFCFAPLIGVFDKGEDLVKDFYIPEIRIYEELRPFINPRV